MKSDRALGEGVGNTTTLPVWSRRLWWAGCLLGTRAGRGDGWIQREAWWASREMARLEGGRHPCSIPGPSLEERP